MALKRPPVVHLIHSGGFYGAERMLLDHCLHVPGRHEVVFFQPPAELLDRFRAAGVRCTDCGGLIALLRLLRGRAVVLNAHNFKAQVFAWLAARHLGLPLLLTQHGFTPRSRKQRLYTRLALAIAGSRAVTRVICVSRALARLHQAHGIAGERLSVIPNGLPPLGESLPDTPAEAQSAMRIGFIGRLSSEKGPDLFLDAVIPLCQARPGLQAVMLGDGPEAPRLRERLVAAGLAERISLPGYQSDSQAWLRQLSVLVLSSRTEGTPLILLEAMRAGVPIVAFAVGGVPDMLEHERSALLAPPGSTLQLAAGIARLLEAPALAQSLAREARLRQKQDFHLPLLVAAWLQVYTQASRGLAP
ncbi:glycosyl transferase family 1 [Pseudomonas oryzihabitans]|uniref:glycosyltransferase family 4 protein n=1 Tax=Pseudomonas oryzihabitans TaxID=47885 RepID=UPI00165E4932|nr:glycosyltransferase family 4 protein [Pseudomonas psychrotolerans]QNQ99915.1 glycosyl transferase family 1 [Pseudomonas psychrotolerans]